METSVLSHKDISDALSYRYFIRVPQHISAPCYMQYAVALFTICGNSEGNRGRLSILSWPQGQSVCPTVQAHFVNTPKEPMLQFFLIINSLTPIHRFSANIPPTVLHRHPIPPKFSHPLTLNISIPLRSRPAIQTTRNSPARLGSPGARSRLRQPAQ